jgi:hypothetical protein
MLILGVLSDALTRIERVFAGLTSHASTTVIEGLVACLFT